MYRICPCRYVPSPRGSLPNASEECIACTCELCPHEIIHPHNTGHGARPCYPLTMFCSACFIKTVYGGLGVDGSVIEGTGRCPICKIEIAGADDDDVPYDVEIQQALIQSVAHHVPWVPALVADEILDPVLGAAPAHEPPQHEEVVDEVEVEESDSDVEIVGYAPSPPPGSCRISPINVV